MQKKYIFWGDLEIFLRFIKFLPNFDQNPFTIFLFSDDSLFTGTNTVLSALERRKLTCQVGETDIQDGSSQHHKNQAQNESKRLA